MFSEILEVYVDVIVIDVSIISTIETFKPLKLTFAGK